MGLLSSFVIWLINPYCQLWFLWMIISAGSRRNSEGAQALAEEASRAPSSSVHWFWNTINAGFMGDYFKIWMLEITTSYNSTFKCTDFHLQEFILSLKLCTAFKKNITQKFLHMILAGISEQTSSANIFTASYSSFSSCINNIQGFTCFISSKTAKFWTSRNS